jgi:integrase/recombinase XerD
VAPGKDTAVGDETIKEKRDRAILSTLLYHALRREELCKLKVKDFKHARRGVPHLKVAGKGEKTRYLPLHPGTNELIHDYLDAAGHGEDENGALFRPRKNNRTGRLEKALSPDAIYKIVRRYSADLGFEIGAHALRATAATNALDHQADIAKVQEWLGHANIATTRVSAGSAQLAAVPVSVNNRAYERRPVAYSPKPCPSLMCFHAASRPEPAGSRSSRLISFPLPKS